ncbi:hypothetical protein F3Y22_tig00111659pilonHSYRG00213 [Hibiscus syriacus]|uniref:Uncharacterized protein n=1 Tax=Hibiscus syriacus TaxID=106335 RepID=A0A6A2YC35_HIBSY|nr:hypothetical protein F3Y22_tig00111659pilonHSYRG00213 [Hibiscus syriacus]
MRVFRRRKKRFTESDFSFIHSFHKHPMLYKQVLGHLVWAFPAFLGSSQPAPTHRELGFSHWAFDTSRCKRLPENVEATYMGEELWTVMICSISRSMEAEEDAERLLHRTEKLAFAAFKISLNVQLNKPYM